MQADYNRLRGWMQERKVKTMQASYELEELKTKAPDFLPQARKVGYVCPVCDNGTGESGDGLILDRSDKTRTHYKCFKCGFYGDVIDLIGLHFGIQDDKAKFEKAFEYYGIQRTPHRRKRSGGNIFTQKETGNTRRTERTQSTEEPQEDYTTFFLQAETQNDYKYLQGRGISEETQKRFHVGFVPNWKSPQAIKTTLAKGGNPDNLPTSPRCIIPRSEYNYLARDIRSDLTADQKKFEKQNAGRTSLFNADALRDATPVFIVEGEIDAMSIYEAGGNACGLCSAANRALLLNRLKEEGRAGQAFILMLDNDEAGKQAQAELEKGLQEMGLAYVCAEYPAGIKDPNQYLQEDPAGLETAVFSLQAQAVEAAKNQKGNEYNALDLLDYFKTIETQPAGFEAKTGFNELDTQLCGGLHEGLYIIGAISSLGKTTFTLQIADQIAGTGQDVIFISLEMSKYELIAKSISRHSFNLKREAKTKDGKRFLARDTQQILNNRRYSFYDADEKQTIKEAIADYEKEAPHIFIYEGRYMGERLKVSHIREIVKNHIASTGNKPVVFVDYLQILAPEDTHATDKQNTDTNTFELKEISRDFNIPVFAVSSFNRDNYNEPVTMQSFKESGAIEYSSDVLLGLQYTGMDYIGGETDKKRKERLRELIQRNLAKKRNKEPIQIDLKCLKQRNGYQFTIEFYMMPAFNHFESILGRAGLEEWKKVHEENTPFKKM